LPDAFEEARYNEMSCSKNNVLVYFSEIQQGYALPSTPSMANRWYGGCIKFYSNIEVL
jgi:hypothetical protein